MARINFSALVSSMSGSIGQACFQKGRSGFIVRNKPLPTNSYSEKRTLSRIYVQQVQKEWADLTIAQKEQWNSFLSFAPSYMKNDKSILLSGYTLFLKYNLVRLHAGFSILTSFTFTDLVYKDIIPTIWYLGGSFGLLFTESFNYPNDFILFKISPKLSQPSYSKKNKMKVIQLDQNGGSPISNFNLTTDYTSLFGYGLEEDDVVLISVLHFSTIAPIMRSDKFFLKTVEVL